jgi:ankyrin repeat protein
MQAAGSGNIGGVWLLLLSGADVNVRDRSGQSALMWAMKRDQPDIVDLLKQAGGKEFEVIHHTGPDADGSPKEGSNGS